MDVRKALGARGEDMAADYLRRQGWLILDRNWSCGRRGELDIVAVEPGAVGDTLVFCEVKTRSGIGYGQPLEAITHEKLRRLNRLALAWLGEHTMGFARIRIDGIGVLLEPSGRARLTHTRGVQ